MRNDTLWDIEGIVQKVVARLREAMRPAAADAPIATVDDGSCVLSLGERVISLNTIEGRLEGVKYLAVGDRAVVTPAVHDELKRVGVTIQRQRGNTKSGNVWVAVTSCFPERESAGDSLAAQLKATLLPQSDLREAVAVLAQRLQHKGAQAMLLTGAPDLAACWANRHECVRAATAWEPHQLSEALQQLSPNLVVVGPTAAAHLDQFSKLIATPSQGGG